MAKDAPNPADFFGPGAGAAPAPAAPVSVNPEDYFGPRPAPPPPEQTWLGKAKEVAGKISSLAGDGADTNERPAGERRGGSRRETEKPYAAGKSLADAAPTEKMAPGQVPLTEGVKPGPGYRTAKEPDGARQAYSSGRQPYEDRRAAIDDAVDMIEGGADRQKVYDQLMKSPAVITQFEIDTRGHELGGPQFTTDPRKVEVRTGALNGEMSRRDPGLGENLANFGTRAAETVGRTSDLLANEAGLMGNEATAGRIAARGKKIDAAMPALENLEGQGAISAAGKEGFGPAIAAMRENPMSFFTMLADSMAQSLPISLVAGTIGAVTAGPPGAAAAAYAGSGAQEYAAALVEAISAGGRDARNPVDVLAALNDPKLMADARARGVKRGLVVGAFDALSAGLAGKFMLPVVKAIESGAAVGGKAMRAAGVASAKEMGLQAGLGMAGEAGGALAAGDKINAADVLMEGFAEIPGSIPEAAGNIRYERQNPNSRMAAAIDQNADLWTRYFQGKPVMPDAKGFTKPQPPTVTLKDSLARFDEVAAAFGLNPEAAARVREQAGGKPAGDVAGFLARVTGALNKRGLFQRPVNDAGIQQLDETINGATPPDMAVPPDEEVPGANGGQQTNTAPGDEPLDAGGLLGTVDEGAHGAATSPTNDLAEPTEGQKKAGNYQVGRIKLGGLDISVENPQGSVRRGVDEDGKAWENELQHHYGYIRRTVGNDGDHVDAFIKPGTPEGYAGPVYVVDQRNPKTGAFDEHKVLLGFDSPGEAEDAYRSNYAPGWDGLGYLSGMDMPAFQSWIKNGDHKQPFSAGFKEKRSAQPDLEVPPAVAAGPGVPGGAVAGGSRGTVGSQPGGDGSGVGTAAAAPVPGGGTPVPAGGRSKPNTALSDKPDYEATFPRPLGGKNSQFDGLEDDEPTLSKAVAGVHKKAADDIATSLKAARAAVEAGDKGALGEAMTEIDGTLGEYADDFGPDHAKAFQAKTAPDLDKLRSSLASDASEKPVKVAPPAPAPAEESDDERRIRGAIDGSLEDMRKMLGAGSAPAPAPAPAPAEPWSGSEFAPRIEAMLTTIESPGIEGATQLAKSIRAGLADKVKAGKLDEAAVSFLEDLTRREMARYLPKPTAWEPMTLERLSENERSISKLPEAIQVAAVARMNELGPALAALGAKDYQEVNGAWPKEAQAAAKALLEVVQSLLQLAPARYRDAKGYKNLNPDKLQRAEDFATEKLGIDTRAYPGIETDEQITTGGIRERKERARTASRGVSFHPKTIWGSELLADISRQLGGLSPDLMTSLSFKQETGKFTLGGTPITRWHNPSAGKNVPGGLFRPGGMGDTNELAQWMEREGYILPGTYEDDYKAADEEARRLITAALNKEATPTMAELEREAESLREEEDAYYRGMALADAEQAEEVRRFLMGEAMIAPADMDIPEDAWFDADNEVWQGPQTYEDLLQSFGLSDAEINSAIFQEQRFADANNDARDRRESEAGQEAGGNVAGRPGAPDPAGEGAPGPADSEAAAEVDALIAGLSDPDTKVVAGFLGMEIKQRTPSVLRTQLLLQDAGAVKAAIERARRIDQAGDSDAARAARFVAATVPKLFQSQVKIVADAMGITGGSTKEKIARLLELDPEAVAKAMELLKNTPIAEDQQADGEFELEAPTLEQLQAEADRADQSRRAEREEQAKLAAAEAARKRALEKQRADAEAEKIRKERADAAVDGFELGQEPPSATVTNSDIVGQQDIFAAPEEQSAPTATRDEALIDLRKRASVLKSLRDCLG